MQIFWTRDERKVRFNFCSLVRCLWNVINQKGMLKGNRAKKLRVSTETRQRSHRDPAATLQRWLYRRLSRDSTETLQRIHRGCTETPQRLRIFRDSTKIHRDSRDSAEILRRPFRDSTKVLQKSHSDSTESWSPRNDSLEMSLQRLKDSAQTPKRDAEGQRLR